MCALILEVDGLSKQYRLGQAASADRQLRDLITRGVKRVPSLFSSRSNSRQKQQRSEFWALRDVSFNVSKGDVVGIIGRNGAGKSTLLKILSRITDPTLGHARIRGRVGSLLEVGTGFHPELTGRENIFLNGAILGMTRAEIKARFDEIVEFSEIEAFLDTPAKRYSSGMYVRLAFAVAAHLEPDILIVDEVLAVGDAGFQRKCLGKMQEVAHAGRTVLFVSHNMGAVESLCSRGLVISSGRKVADTSAEEAIQVYLREMETSSDADLADREDRSGKGGAKVLRIELASGRDFTQSTLVTGAPARFTFHLSHTHPDLIVVFSIYDTMGQSVVDFRSRYPGDHDRRAPELRNEVRCETDELLLAPGRYRMDVELHGDRLAQDHIQGAVYFDVAPGQIRGRMASEPIRHARAMMPCRWVLPLKEQR